VHSETLLELTRDEIAELCRALEGAIAAHSEWNQIFHRSLVTVQEIPPHYFEEHSYLSCKFGQWLTKNSEFIERNNELKAIEQIHRVMHQEACKLSHLYRQNKPIQVEEYDAFLLHRTQLTKRIRDMEASLRLAGTMFDSLTGAFTRHAMMPILTQEVSRIKRLKHDSCVVMVDLDHFKKINDTHGHLGGDKVLKACGEFLKEHIRPYDSLFRYGGEEFLICVQNCDCDTALATMERVKESLSELPIHIGIDQEIFVTASIGVASLSKSGSIEEAISRADQALYAAKRAGRNRVICYSQLPESECKPG
jgi:diguanylate cyclase (GGDEF)-like protein